MFDFLKRTLTGMIAGGKLTPAFVAEAIITAMNKNEPPATFAAQIAMIPGIDKQLEHISADDFYNFVMQDEAVKKSINPILRSQMKTYMREIVVATRAAHAQRTGARTT